MEAVKHALDCENLNLKGLHCHIGSQIFETEPYEDAVEIMMKFIKEIKEQTGYTIHELDLGGGFGIHYTDGDNPKSIKEYCKVILKKVDEVMFKFKCRKTYINDRTRKINSWKCWNYTLYNWSN